MLTKVDYLSLAYYLSLASTTIQMMVLLTWRGINSVQWKGAELSVGVSLFDGELEG